MEAYAPQRVFDVVAYNNKRYTVPAIDRGEGVTRIAPRDGAAPHLPPRDEPVVRDLGAVFDVARFLDARRPVSVGALSAEERARFVAPSDARNVLDRLPWEQVPLGLRIVLNRGARLAQSARAACQAR